jgi:hypothetical protein
LRAAWLAAALLALGSIAPGAVRSASGAQSAALAVRADTTHRSYAGVHDQVAVRRFDELVLGIRGAILKEIGHG